MHGHHINQIIVSEHAPKNNKFYLWLHIHGSSIHVIDNKRKTLCSYDNSKNYITLNGKYKPNVWNVAFGIA